jgi:hypothetical protein
MAAPVVPVPPRSFEYFSSHGIPRSHSALAIALIDSGLYSWRNGLNRQVLIIDTLNISNDRRCREQTRATRRARRH